METPPGGNAVTPGPVSGKDMLQNLELGHPGPGCRSEVFRRMRGRVGCGQRPPGESKVGERHAA